MIAHPCTQDEGIRALGGVHPRDARARPEGGDVKARKMRVGALQPIAGDHRIDEAGVVLSQGGFIQARTLQGCRANICQEDIRRRRKPRQGIPSLRFRNVQHDRALAPVVDRKGGVSGDGVLGVREDMAHRIAFRALDLDHVGTPVAQDACGARCCDVGSKLYDFQSFEQHILIHTIGVGVSELVSNQREGVTVKFR